MAVYSHPRRFGYLRSVSSLSVLVHCFNHVRTLQRCLDSILEQDFLDIDVTIVDDASSDGSSDLARDIARVHRDRVRVWVSPTNVGRAQQAWWLSGLQLSGTYWTRIDGDDAWVNRERAKRQIELLEVNQSWVGVSAITELWDGSSSESRGFIESAVAAWSFRDWYKGVPMLYCHMNSVIWRATPETRYMLQEDLGTTWPKGEWPLTLGVLALSRGGVMGKWPHVGSLYDVSTGGIWSSLSQEQQEEANLNADLAMRRNVKILRSEFKRKTHNVTKDRWIGRLKRSNRVLR